ncbi:flagellar hook-length control protein FliK [Photobacterium sp. BZF1]|uniref:flagellar hook-length control protein FliK n=1 Tax=Photobacterium sp. BZF1 TaxID=1904457 RepID=UPI001653916D|nr:flagellar hook-length control protein FliK [Photobacterium sp. BZF1]MBC7002152.1 flagellar hook-length control protein FliK [Photobacterium sp. BZF1]
MLLSQFLSADTASSAAAQTPKASSGADSKAKDSASATSSGAFTETLQGAIGADPAAENKNGPSVAAKQQPADEQEVEKTAQDVENAELLAKSGSKEAVISSASDKDGKEQAVDTDEQDSSDEAVSTGVATLSPGASLSSPQNAKGSMTEGEELLQRLSASRSQLAGHSAAGQGQAVDGKLLPPDASAEGTASEADGTVSKEMLGKDSASKEALLKDGLAKDGVAIADGKSAKVDSNGKVALSGMTVSGADLAELKNSQGTSPLSSGMNASGLNATGVSANSALTSSTNSELAALMGQSTSSGSLKGSLATKGNASALAAASMDSSLSTMADDGLGTSLGETQGAHAALRSATAGMMVAEGDKPGNAQPPLLLTKEQAGEQLADRVQMMMSKNLKHVDIRLDPPELGKMQIKLSMNNDQASVQITVANQQSRDLVEQAMPRLRELLHQQGLQLAQSTVQQDSSRQFAGGSQQQANGQPGSQPQHGGQGSSQGNSHDHANGSAAPAHTADLWMTAPKDGVDYYA